MREGERAIAREVAVAISYRGATQAVLMASPHNLDALGIGFTLTEGIVPHAEAILGTEVIETELGYEVRVDIDDIYLDNLVKRRRFMAGPVGCGLCGIDSLEQAIRKLPSLKGVQLVITAEDVARGLTAMAGGQLLNRQTKAMHAAAFYLPKTGLTVVCEDVGRHNAFDKLIGTVIKRPELPIASAIAVVSSRLSVEMVQKAAMFGVPVLVAVSAPTSLAIDVAKEVGLTLIAVARGEDFEVFNGAERIAF